MAQKVLKFVGIKEFNGSESHMYSFVGSQEELMYCFVSKVIGAKQTDYVFDTKLHDMRIGKKSGSLYVTQKGVAK